MSDQYRFSELKWAAAEALDSLDVAVADLCKRVNLSPSRAEKRRLLRAVSRAIARFSAMRNHVPQKWLDLRDVLASEEEDVDEAKRMLLGVARSLFNLRNRLTGSGFLHR